ncbi:hypothetical protein Ciccas_003014 [Cichlidogyrus casuarinus]|uniref:DNA/RNA-binding domain-containing protein n=1 Tax=Cichlidogyrus casuarinus TaxID=1844966 RepID=A0ABD2QG71_9PLAT
MSHDLNAKHSAFILYKKALHIQPDNGFIYNQLGLLDVGRCFGINSLYYFLCSLTLNSEKGSVQALRNLDSLYKSNLEKYEDLNAIDSNVDAQLKKFHGFRIKSLEPIFIRSVHLICSCFVSEESDLTAISDAILNRLDSLFLSLIDQKMNADDELFYPSLLRLLNCSLMCSQLLRQRKLVSSYATAHAQVYKNFLLSLSKIFIVQANQRFEDASSAVDPSTKEEEVYSTEEERHNSDSSQDEDAFLEACQVAHEKDVSDTESEASSGRGRLRLPSISSEGSSSDTSLLNDSKKKESNFLCSVAVTVNKVFLTFLQIYVTNVKNHFLDDVDSYPVHLFQSWISSFVQLLNYLRGICEPSVDCLIEFGHFLESKSLIRHEKNEFKLKDIEESKKREEMMRSLAKMRLESEVQGLQSKLTKSTSSPIVLLDAYSFVTQFHEIKRLLFSKKFIVGIAHVTVAKLDQLKNETALARRVIRFLEEQSFKGEKLLRMQSLEESLPDANPWASILHYAISLSNKILNVPMQNNEQETATDEDHFVSLSDHASRKSPSMDSVTILFSKMQDTDENYLQVPASLVDRAALHKVYFQNAKQFLKSL